MKVLEGKGLEIGEPLIEEYQAVWKRDAAT